MLGQPGKLDLGRGLASERKHVSVLFADLSDSLRLLDEDPEDAQRLLEDVLQLMGRSVRQFGGTVAQAMGDGVMALFGAPVAYEDHALRACRAALAMQETIRAQSRQRGTEAEIRVGICSGEVVAGLRGQELELQYTAFGRTAHLAARMERMARPGSVLITGSTWQLVAGLAEGRSLGAMPVRGLEHPVEVFELLSITCDGGRRRRRSMALPLVGRQSELQQMEDARSAAVSGEGRVVALVGEPGVGKSRLLDEFLARHDDSTCLVLRAYGVSHGQAAPFSAIIEALSSGLDLDDRGDPAAQRKAISELVERYGGDLEQHLPALLALFGILDESSWRELPLEQRRRAIGKAVVALLSARSRDQPLMVTVDDLQWVDADSLSIVTTLAQSLAGAAVLLVAVYRPGFDPGWDGIAWCRQLWLGSLNDAQAELFLDSLLGQDPTLGRLRRLLLERTGGNPFFLEEVVRSLAASGDLEGDPGRYRLLGEVGDLQVPAQVQDVIAMRIDGLSFDEKRVLRAAACIGYEVDRNVLGAVAEVDESALTALLEHLEASELLLDAPELGDSLLVFKHALTHDVAYWSLLRQDRKRLHGRTVEALERLYGERLGEHSEILAFHAKRAEDWGKALSYFQLAGKQALTRSACQRAVDCFEAGLDLLERLPAGPALDEVALDMRLALRNALMVLGRHRDIVPHLKAAEPLARRLGDQERLAQIYSWLAHYHWLVGEWQDSILAGRLALSTAERLTDSNLTVITRFILGLAAYSTGSFAEACEHLSWNARVLVGPRVSENYGMFSLPAVVSRGWLAWCEVERGRFEEALRQAREAKEITDRVGRPFDRVQGLLGLGGTYLLRGDVEAALPLLEPALALCEKADVRVLLPRVAAALGYAFGLSGRLDEALRLARRSVEVAETLHLASMRTVCLRWVGEIQLLAKDVEEALAVADGMLTSCRASGEAGYEAWALYLKGAALSLGGRPDAAVEALAAAESRARRLGMRLLSAHIHHVRSELSETAGQAVDRAQDREAAERLYRDMGMDAWLRALHAGNLLPLTGAH